MSAEVARSHDGDGGGEDRPLPHHVPSGCMGCFANRDPVDLRPHMESPDWIEINAGIQQHLQKAYNTNKFAFKAQHWVIDPMTGTYDVEKIRRARPENITASEWDKQSSTTQEYPSLIDTFFVAHTVNGEFLRDEDRRGDEEVGGYGHLDEINRLARGGKQRGHIPGFESGGASGSGGCEEDEEGVDHQDDNDEDGDGDT
uniref:Putative ribonuclease H-like domain-containing protein n=1 Tax=Tanacetum cinerariifolium TaxID=118510 RepID=A0A6L2J7T0_TANCI|nr:putative ribonuclease H-like domain-containing protein [Tanacetum cinerariifolium]